METGDLWNEWVEPFDLFISYARKDNETGMVSALVAAIEADFTTFSPTLPLKVFFDKKSILDMQHWQNVLKKGLRQSKVMLAVLSEAYFTSEWCRREWEEYLLVEQARVYPGEALTPIFIVAPEELRKTVPPAAKAWWDDVTARNAVVEIHPFWPKGRAALQERIVVERLRRLQQNIRARVEHGRELAKVPRDIHGRNPNFVGRKVELARIRDALSRYEMVGVCAVNGIGGIGKTSVAREYAYLFRREYLGGQFEIDLSTISSIRGVQDQLVRIARDYLGARIPPELPEAEQHARAKAAFQQLPAGHAALLILDNLNEDCTGIVGRTNREAALPAAEKVHLLVTTRAEPRGLGGMETITLDTLPPTEALDLLFRSRPFTRNPEAEQQWLTRTGSGGPEAATADADREWKAALAIVQRLGRHTLAVALVGAYLGSYPDVAYEQFARELDAHGIGIALEVVGYDDNVKNLIQHPETLIGAPFERSLVRLNSPLALRALEYAAFLPPDLVPLAWLKRLVEQDSELADAREPKPFQPPPWAEALRRLAGLQYLVGQPYARMHRVVQEVLRRRMKDAERSHRLEIVLADVEALARRNWTDHRLYSDLNEIRAVEQLIRLDHAGDHPLVGSAALWLVNLLQNLGRLRNAVNMARLAHRILKQTLTADPDSSQKQRDLSVSFNKLGNVSVAAGDLAAARAYYEQYLTIARALADADPDAAEKQRDLGVCHFKLFDVEFKLGDRAAARAQLEAFVVVWGKLAADGRMPSPQDHSVLRYRRQQLDEWAD